MTFYILSTLTSVDYLSTFHALLDAGYLNRIGAFFAFFDIEFDPVAVLDFVDEAGLVHENFFLVIVGYDEAEAFGIVVKFNGAGEHSGGGGMIMKCHPPLPATGRRGCGAQK